MFYRILVVFLLSISMFFSFNASAEKNIKSQTVPAKNKVTSSTKIDKTQSNTVSIQDSINKLNSQNIEEVQAALKELGNSGSKNAVTPIIDLLNKGMPDSITESALEALGSIADPQSINILISFANHRRAKVRVIAIQALSTIKAPSVRRDIIGALENGLRDSDEEVRSNAAIAIGEAGFSEAVKTLFMAYDRGVTDAAISIGKLGNKDDSERLAAYLGQRDLAILLEGLGEFLRRDNFPEDGKIAIVDKLLEISGPQVREFLVSYLAELPENPQNRVRQRVQEAIASIPE